MIFDQGTAVGIEAQKRYPGGILIDCDYLHQREALKATAEALAKKPTAIFEAAFVFNNTLVRIDILKRNRGGSWDIVEVKSSTDLKDEHIHDLAIQRYVAEGAGLKISRAVLMHINRECVYPDLDNLFVFVDCTERVAGELKAVPEQIQEMFAALALKKAPKVEIGPHCDSPYECAFKAQCWGHVPEHSVFELNGVWVTSKFELYERGILLIKDIEESEKVSRAKPGLRKFFDHKLMLRNSLKIIGLCQINKDLMKIGKGLDINVLGKILDIFEIEISLEFYDQMDGHLPGLPNPLVWYRRSEAHYDDQLGYTNVFRPPANNRWRSKGKGSVAKSYNHFLREMGKMGYIGNKDRFALIAEERLDNMISRIDSMLSEIAERWKDGDGNVKRIDSLFYALGVDSRKYKLIANLINWRISLDEPFPCRSRENEKVMRFTSRQIRDRLLHN